MIQNLVKFFLDLLGKFFIQSESGSVKSIRTEYPLEASVYACPSRENVGPIDFRGNTNLCRYIFIYIFILKFFVYSDVTILWYISERIGRKKQRSKCLFFYKILLLKVLYYIY